MSKQDERTKLAKEKLIAAASKLFNERSIESVGIREICAEAGVTTGTFYHHYHTKLDIVHAIHDVHDEQFGVVLDELAKEGPYCDKIIYFFVHTMAPLIESDGIDFTLHRMFITKKHSDDNYKLYIGMRKLIDLAKENGEIKSCYDTFETNNYFFLVFRGVVYDWCIMPEDKRDSLPRMMKAAMKCAVRSFQN